MIFYDLCTLPCKVQVKYNLFYTPLSEQNGKYKNRFTTVEKKLIDGRDELYVSSEKPFSFIKFTWSCPDYAKGALVLKNEFERGYGHLGWYDKKVSFPSFWYFAVSDKVNTAAYGVMTGASSFCYFEGTENTVSLVCDCRNGSYPLLLGTRTLRMCTLVCTRSQNGENSFYTMIRFCKMLCPSPVLPKTPVYGSNNWYYQYDKATLSTVKADADLLYETTKGLENRPYCVLDDGWMTCSMWKYKERKEDTWQPSPTKFEGDMKKVSNYIHDKDMKAGLWIRTLLGSQKAPLSWRLFPKRKRGEVYLDPSNPDVLNEVATIVKRVRSWGFDLIKHDYSCRDISGLFQKHGKKKITMPFIKFQDRTKTTAEITLQLYKTIREAAGDDIVIIGCNTISHLSAGIFELCRIGDDTSGETWRKVVRKGVNSLGARACHHNTFYACDADCVGHMGIIPWEKNRQWLELLAKSGTPLFTSIDPTKVTDEIKEDLIKAYAISSKQEILAEPLDWLTNDAPTAWKVGDEILHYDWTI